MAVYMHKQSHSVITAISTYSLASDLTRFQKVGNLSNQIRNKKNTFRFRCNDVHLFHAAKDDSVDKCLTITFPCKAPSTMSQ